MSDSGNRMLLRDVPNDIEIWQIGIQLYAFSRCCSYAPMLNFSLRSTRRWVCGKCETSLACGAPTSLDYVVDLESHHEDVVKTWLSVWTGFRSNEIELKVEW